ncbi:hypothetical protein LAWASA_4526 [Lawsonibacter asaccharolyticus]|nr:hypothetical protein LAWASA_4526 [Lawsonibacter asaccharolyticus]
MANNRKQPFGYRMEFGEYTPHPAEAETVRWIYQTYLAGASYQELVEALQERGVAYDEGKLWNKNMVARILEDKRYIGTDRYRPYSRRSSSAARRSAAGTGRSRSGKRRPRWSCGGCAAVPACLGGTADPDASEPSCPAPERIASGQAEMEDQAESGKMRRELEEALQSPPVDGERTRDMALRLAEQAQRHWGGGI